MPSVLPTALAVAATAVTPPVSAAVHVRRPLVSMRRAAPVSAEERRRVEGAIGALLAAERKANESPASGVQPLNEALARFHDLGPLAARDLEAHEARIYALLSLARAHLALEQTDEAAEAMDAAIRVARGDRLPATVFGPGLVELHERRLSAPENRPEGQLTVTCTPACEVVLDERGAGSGTQVEVRNLPLGPHRVHVHATAADVEDILSAQIELTADSPAAALTYAPAAPEAGTETPTSGQPMKDTPARRLPRWAGIVGIAAGAAAMVAGGVLLGLDGRCPDGSDPSGPNTCIDVLNTDKPGIALLVTGGALMTGFGVVLAIGETRDRKRRRVEAMVGTTLRF